jgi:hypothetical protein
VFTVLRKTESEICRYKININVEILKGKVSINVGNSSEDGVCVFLVVWCIEAGIFWKVWHLIGTFCFDVLVDLKIVFV